MKLRFAEVALGYILFGAGSAWADTAGPDVFGYTATNNVTYLTKVVS